MWDKWHDGVKYRTDEQSDPPTKAAHHRGQAEDGRWQKTRVPEAGNEGPAEVRLSGGGGAGRFGRVRV